MGKWDDEKRLSEYQADFIPAVSSRGSCYRVFNPYVHVGQASFSFSIDEVVVPRYPRSADQGDGFVIPLT